MGMLSGFVTIFFKLSCSFFNFSFQAASVQTKATKTDIKGTM